MNCSRWCRHLVHHLYATCSPAWGRCVTACTLARRPRRSAKSVGQHVTNDPSWLWRLQGTPAPLFGLAAFQSPNPFLSGFQYAHLADVPRAPPAHGRPASGSASWATAPASVAEEEYTKYVVTKHPKMCPDQATRGMKPSIRDDNRLGSTRAVTNSSKRKRFPGWCVCNMCRVNCVRSCTTPARVSPRTRPPNRPRRRPPAAPIAQCANLMITNKRHAGVRAVGNAS